MSYGHFFSGIPASDPDHWQEDDEKGHKGPESPSRKPSIQPPNHATATTIDPTNAPPTTSTTLIRLSGRLRPRRRTTTEDVAVRLEGGVQGGGFARWAEARRGVAHPASRVLFADGGADRQHRRGQGTARHRNLQTTERYMKAKQERLRQLLASKVKEA